MKGLKVVLFISFVFVAISGLIGVFSPATLTATGMTAKNADPAYTRVFSTAAIALALAMWYTFRDPAKNEVIVRVVITWFGLEGIVLLISGIQNTIPMSSALPGVIFDGVLAILLAVFYPKARKASA